MLCLSLSSFGIPLYGALIDIVSVFEDNCCYVVWFSVPMILSASFLEINYSYLIRDR